MLSLPRVMNMAAVCVGDKIKGPGSYEFVDMGCSQCNDVQKHGSPFGRV